MELTFRLETKDIHIRDPFILPVPSEQLYYMYASGTTDDLGRFLMAYRSKDLQHWSDPIKVFEAPPDFWAQYDFWAPEVHLYQGHYFVFMSFRADNRHRGTQILKSDSPAGPFAPISEGPVTPSNWECLDGTLWVEEGHPYMVFCHEWTQVGDGSMWLMPLTDDLTAAAGRQKYLFSSSEAPWGIQWERKNHIGLFDLHSVTDGPWLYRSSKGRLFMFWSSFGQGDYMVGLAESRDGRIDGEWFQHPEPVFENGGHCMLFKDFSGQLRMSLHSPNTGKEPRLNLLNVAEDADGKPYILKNN